MRNEIAPQNLSSEDTPVRGCFLSSSGPFTSAFSFKVESLFPLSLGILYSCLHLHRLGNFWMSLIDFGLLEMSFKITVLNLDPLWLHGIGPQPHNSLHKNVVKSWRTAGFSWDNANVEVTPSSNTRTIWKAKISSLHCLFPELWRLQAGVSWVYGWDYLTMGFLVTWTSSWHSGLGLLDRWIS